MSSIKYNIPQIKLNLYANWADTIEVDFEKSFSVIDLYLVLKSYSDCVSMAPLQILVQVHDKEESRKPFFTESLAPRKLSLMSVDEFSIWYNDRWTKDAKYLGHEVFQHKILFKYSSTKKNGLFPIYPWNTKILEEVISGHLSGEKDEYIKYLLSCIEELKKGKN